MDILGDVYAFVTGGVPSYTQTMYDIKWGMEYCLENCTETDSYSPMTFFESLQKYAAFEPQRDLSLIAGLAVTWTVLRYVLTFAVFSPLASCFKLKPLNAKKYPESVWKLIVYTILWSFTCYVIFGMPEHNNIYFDPDSIWADYKPGMKIDKLIYYLYMLQLSFYFHSIYGSLFMDVWRDDSMVMMFHHFLTISLIGFSYVCRYHKIGVLVLFVHDATDIALEFTKCNVYFKDRAGKFYRTHDILSTLGFVTFAVFWYLFRLYWLPLKVLHSTGYGTMYHHQTHQLLPFYFFFNGMLWTLQLMNAWWFMFIINFLIKVATGQISEVDDIREEDVQREKMRKKKHQDRLAGGDKPNGISKSQKKARSKKAD